MEKSTLAETKLGDSFEHVEQSAHDINQYDDSIEDTKPSNAVWLITFTVAMGGFLFGLSFSLALTQRHKGTDQFHRLRHRCHLCRARDSR